METDNTYIPTGHGPVQGFKNDGGQLTWGTVAPSVETAPWLPKPQSNKLTYRIHQGCLMAFRDGKVLPASLKHRWKVQFVTRAPEPQLTGEQMAQLALIQQMANNASTGA